MFVVVFLVLIVVVPFFTFFFNDTATTEIYSLSLHVALPIFLEGTLQAGTSAVFDKLLDLVGLGGKSAADKGKDTRDYLAAAFPELNAWERAGADASSAGMVDAGFENQKERSEERFSRNAETEIVCRLLLEKKNRPGDHQSAAGPRLLWREGRAKSSLRTERG